jgi:hypothetical protein
VREIGPFCTLQPVDTEGAETERIGGYVHVLAIGCNDTK